MCDKKKILLQADHTSSEEIARHLPGTKNYQGRFGQL